MDQRHIFTFQTYVCISIRADNTLSQLPVHYPQRIQSVIHLPVLASVSCTILCLIIYLCLLVCFIYFNPWKGG